MEPRRTPSGIRNEHRFYRGQFLVLVEGDDDLPFWAQFVPEATGHLQRHIKAVGGKPALLGYIREFDSDGGRSIVAIDSDYDELLGISRDHDRVLTTVRYSIENVFVCSCRVSRFLTGLCRAADEHVSAVRQWLDEYDCAVESLLAAEIVCIRLSREAPEAVGHADRYLRGHSSDFDSVAIQRRVSQLGVTDVEIKQCLESLRDFPARHHFSGHFLFQAVSRFVREYACSARGRSVSVSSDALFAALVEIRDTCSECQELVELLRDRARAAVAAIAYPRGE